MNRGIQKLKHAAQRSDRKRQQQFERKVPRPTAAAPDPDVAVYSVAGPGDGEWTFTSLPAPKTDQKDKSPKLAKKNAKRQEKRRKKACLELWDQFSEVE